ncbi:MAG: oligosaccharide flippase family protein [Deltaproteobacteria bacterium]|nr:oligosaccharide flippase family protein [Deltaproteobacteria bacterium]
MYRKPMNTSPLDFASVKGRAIKGGKALLIRHVVSFSINITGGIIMARALGPQVLGLYFISYTLLVVFRQLIDFGIGTHLIRLPHEPSLPELKTAFIIQQSIGVLCVAAAVLVISPLASWWYGHAELIAFVASAGVGAYFNSWQSIPLSRLEREMDYIRVGLIEVSEIVAFNAVAVPLTLLGDGVLGLALGNVARGIVPAAIAVFVAGIRPVFSARREEFTSLLRSVYPIIGASVVAWFMLLAPAALVGSLAGARALGVAQLSYTIIGYTMFISTIFQRVGLSSLSKFQDDAEKFNRSVHHALRLLFVIYMPFTMGIASISPWWVPLIYGAQWAGMEKVVLYASIPVTMSALLSIVVSALVSKGFTTLVFKQNIIYVILYWAVMGALASTLGPLSVPAAHILAISAGYMLIRGYSRHCGEIAYRPLVLGFLSGLAVMFFSWYAVEDGYLFVPFVLWTLFLGAFMAASASTRHTVTAFINNFREVS